MNTRITLIVRDWTKAGGDWNYAMVSSMRAVFLESVPALRFALSIDEGLDVARIVIDRAGDADEFLDLLAGMPGHFAGDVLYIRDDGSGLAVSVGRL